MVHYTQSKMHNPPYSSGNCYITTICCIIGFPPEHAPNFEVLFDFKNEDNKGLWWRVIEAWLEEKGYKIECSNDDLWLFHGLCKNQPKEAAESFPQFADKFYMVSGDTERGNWSHIMVYKNGQPYWDPHPSRSGLKHESGVEIIIPIETKTGDRELNITTMRTFNINGKAVTFGEMRVGISFNPGGNPKVESIKRKAADLIDELESYRQEKDSEQLWPGQHQEINICISEAQRDIETAAMYGVKAVTK